jgi:hypothetical protein
MVKYINTVFGYGDNHCAINIYSIIFKKFKMNDIWFPGSQFQIVLDVMCSSENKEFTMIDIDNNIVNCKSTDLPNFTEKINWDNFEIYPDIKIDVKFDGHDYVGFECNEVFDFKESESIKIGKSYCFNGIIISEIPCGHITNYCNVCNSVEINNSDIEAASKIYQRLADEGRMPKGLKLTMINNCHS